MNSCAFAKAMYLFDVQQIEFKPNDYVAKQVTERRVRIKIFNEGGYEYASVKIPYFSKKGVTKIKNLDGIVYNLDSSGNISVQRLEK